MPKKRKLRRMFPHFIRRILVRIEYGASCCKLYSLYYHWTKQLRREIIAYKAYVGQHVDLTYEGFDKDIDKIIRAFDLIIKDEQYGCKNPLERNKQISEGLQLFAKNFERFWY